MGLMHNICTTLIEGVSRFDATALVAAFCKQSITASNPTVTYNPTFLRGDSYLYAVKVVVTRAVRYRNELGMPRVIELRHEGAPTIDAVRAMEMLAKS